MKELSEEYLAKIDKAVQTIAKGEHMSIERTKLMLMAIGADVYNQMEIDFESTLMIRQEVFWETVQSWSKLEEDES